MYAVLDLGTNIFQLLTAHSADWKTWKSYSYPVKLGENSGQLEYITDAAIDRATRAITECVNLLKYESVEGFRLIGTSAFRNAKNGKKLAHSIAEICGHEVEIISGEQEAEYIYQGTLLFIRNVGKSHIIMDIGGGSVEYIIGKNKDILWKGSFEIGAARILEMIHQYAQYNQHEEAKLNNWVEEKLNEVKVACALYKPEMMIGAAGAFMTMLNLLQTNAPILEKNIFYGLYNQLKNATPEMMIHLKGMNLHRVEMIIPAMILTDISFKITQMKQIEVSTGSLKEGVMLHYFSNCG